MSGILLDTHFLYWWMTADRRLGANAQALIARVEVSVSAASLWEMVLKQGRGKLPLPDSPLKAAIEREGFRILPISSEHVEAVRGLPGGLDDPFDRLLLATAKVEGMFLLTRDRTILSFARRLSDVTVQEG